MEESAFLYKKSTLASFFVDHPETKSAGTGYVRVIETPPSTSDAVPVTKAESSEAK